jgi:uncharacterized membrane protein
MSYPNGGYVGPGVIISVIIAVLVLVAVVVWLFWRWLSK